MRRRERMSSAGTVAYTLLLGMTLASGVLAADPARPGPVDLDLVKQQLPALGLLHGPWDGGTVARESVLFVQGEKGNAAAGLLRDAERVIAVTSADGKQTYELGKDFQLSSDGSRLELTSGSRIPFRKASDFLVPKGAPQSIPHRKGDPNTSILFGGGHFFHDMQTEVTYEPRKGAWAGYRPEFAGDRLPHTLAKLRAKEPVTIVVSGDSISYGGDVSGLSHVAPDMPAYPALVAAQLAETYGSKVTLRNLAVGGWSSRNGVADIDTVLKEKGDLIIIAYGMNDVGRRAPDAYKSEIAAMMKRIKEANPDTEVILVSSMLGNPEWVATPTEMFPAYRDALTSLTGPGVVLADVTAVWQKLLERKRFTDMVGNGVNHPNDYGHRLYAETVLGLLVDPKLAAK